MEIIDSRKLKKAIIEKKLNISEVARLTGLQYKIILKFINGDHKARLSTIGKFAAALSIPVDFIIKNN